MDSEALNQSPSKPEVLREGHLKRFEVYLQRDTVCWDQAGSLKEEATHRRFERQGKGRGTSTSPKSARNAPRGTGKAHAASRQDLVRA